MPTTRPVRPHCMRDPREPPVHDLHCELPEIRPSRETMPHDLMTSRRANHPILAASCGATCPSWNSMGLEMRDADAMIHSNTGELSAKLAASQNNGTLKDHLCCLTNLGMQPSRGTNPILRPKLSTISAQPGPPGGSFGKLAHSTATADAGCLECCSARGQRAEGSPRSRCPNPAMSCQILDEWALP